MNDQPNKEPSLADEFRSLGQNLIDTMQAAWESPERKRLQQELGDGLDELAKTIQHEATTFKDSETGQQLKSDMQDFQERVRSGEVESQIREELLKALRMINTQLEKLSNQWVNSDSAQKDSTPETKEG